MRVAIPILRRFTTAVPLLLLAVLAVATFSLSGCNGDSPTAPPRDPGPPPPPPPPPPPANGNYTGNATVLSGSRDGCSWWIGNTNVFWHVQVSGTAIAIDNEFDIVFEGTLQERGFEVTYRPSGNYLDSYCQVRESTISGSFSENWESFEARETIRQGKARNEKVTVQSWTAVKWH